MDGKIETKFEIEWVSVIDDLPSQDEEVMIATFDRFLPSAAWIEDWDTGEPMWYNEQTETELDWTPLFWARYPSLPQRREFAESGYMVSDDYEDEDGYDCFKQYDREGNCIFWTLHGRLWDAFDDNDPDALDPFFDSYIINDTVLDEAWRLLMEMKEAKQ